jgi:Domain of unknown function (DUF4276)
MKIGLLVDGRAEYSALPHLLERIVSPHTILRNPLLCDIQPFASPAQIAHVASKSFPILLHRGADRILILIDKETRQDCTGELAAAVEKEARARADSGVEVRVVLKVKMFENWFVADPEALRGISGRFEKVERIAKQVTPNRADAVDALGLLKTCSKDRTFDKVRDGVAICKVLDPTRAAAGSRSFRKLLKELGVAEAPAGGGRRRRR